ncbi:hypothetical protein BPT24_017 [Tenacibaculum phage pT24]|uniref:Uncharacterized protein n=1 Tax=Tenacibaculum phage pT24 TaxID=1880590 RepID=A0A1B4XWF6_9CAUD|nr:hypothetical protein HYP10_gp017 [Tenacibaculum phage pT24]BAV39139.1 hypothetical protein BPT24_017 [Tenacibaculum phage pT24]
MNNNLQPVSIQQALIIDFLRENPNSNIKEISEGIEKQMSVFSETNRGFENDLPKMISGLKSSGYIDVNLIRHRKAYSLTK